MSDSFAARANMAVLIAIICVVTVAITLAFFTNLGQRRFVTEYPPRLMSSAGPIELGPDGEWHPVK